MPIACKLTVRNLTQAEFDERDAVVMRCAYAAQNALGRLCDERIYECDLARRLRMNGFASVHTQVPVLLIHQDFAKEYLLDLVADDVVYELKAASALVSQHDAQALHYAMLMNVNHVKLLNFRSGKVQGKLLFNPFLDDKRRAIQWDEDNWRSISPQCDELKSRLRALLEDWGACLEVRLYNEALIHFFGGEMKCTRRLPVRLDGMELGSHTAQSHADGLCFFLTAFTTGLTAQRSHIRRLQALTRLRAIQWINFNHTTVQLFTIQS